MVLDSDQFTERDKESIRYIWEKEKAQFLRNASRPQVPLEEVKKVQARLVAEGAPKAEDIDPNKYIKTVKWFS